MAGHTPPGHFNNDNSRHSDANNSRQNPPVLGLLLHDQQEVHPRSERNNMPLQEGAIYGTAQPIPTENIDIQEDIESDSFSLAPIIAHGIGQQSPVEETSQSSENPSPGLQQDSFGVNVRAETNSLNAVGEGQSFRQSASVFSQTNMNVASPQMQTLSSGDLAIAPNRQATITSSDTRGSLAVSGVPAAAREEPAERQSPGHSVLPVHVSENAVLPPTIGRLNGQQNQATTDRLDEQQLRPEIVGNTATGIENTEVKRSQGDSRMTATVQARAEASSVSMTSTERYRTAPGAQGGADRYVSSQPFVSAENTAQRGPEHPKYADMESRFVTFLKFPKAVTQSPQALAEAGLFYTGEGDLCKCYYCGGGIRRWEPNDKPLDEHIRLHPNCAYAIRKKQEQSQDQVQNTAARNENFGDIDAVIYLLQGVMGYPRESVSLAVVEYKRRVQDGRILRSDDVTCAIVEILTEMERQREPLPLTVQGDTPSLAGGANSRMTPTVQARGQASSVSMQYINAQGGGDRDMSSQQYVSANSIGGRPNSMDASFCTACKLKPATISQLECGHIMCRDCAPCADDRSGKKLCKRCHREVVECNPIDVSCYQNR